MNGGRTIVERIEPGGVGLELERPATPDELLDDERFADDEFLPYWAELWPSGIALAEHVAGLALGGLDVLELGCGLGVPSLVAAARSGRVVATDWASEALVLLEANAERNGVALQALRMDWREPAILAGRRFDLVLAADVLYEARNVEPLLDVLPQLLRAGGEVLLADPGRAHAERFLHSARLGDAEVHTEPHGLLPRGGIHRCRCPPSGDELMRS